MKNHILILLVFLMCSCTTTKYIEVPIETVRTEYKVKKDSVYLHDSINIYTEIKGDTVYINKTKYKLKETFKTDTLTKVDSIPVVVTVDKVVKVNELYFWLKLLMFIGGVGVLIIFGFLIYKFKAWKLLF